MLMHDPQTNIVCFRILPEGVPAEKLNELHLQVRENMMLDGRFYLVQTKLRGQVCFRVALMNPFTTVAVLEELLQEIRKSTRSVAFTLH